MYFPPLLFLGIGCFQRTHALEREAHVFVITALTLSHTRDPVIHNNEPFQMEAAKWNSAIIGFIIYISNFLLAQKYPQRKKHILCLQKSILDVVE